MFRWLGHVHHHVTLQNWKSLKLTKFIICFQILSRSKRCPKLHVRPGTALTWKVMSYKFTLQSIREQIKGTSSFFAPTLIFFPDETCWGRPSIFLIVLRNWKLLRYWYCQIHFQHNLCSLKHLLHHQGLIETKLRLSSFSKGLIKCMIQMTFQPHKL